MRVLLLGRYCPEAFLDSQFCLSAEDGAVDWLVVLDETVLFLKTRIPKERRVVFVTEAGLRIRSRITAP
jgi:hypothetical protein